MSTTAVTGPVPSAGPLPGPDYPRVPPHVLIMLDFIAIYEAGRDGYNAAYRSMTVEDLSKLTLKQVLAKQAAALKAGAKSTALGRYQFISTTLKSVTSEKPTVSPSALFTPNLQDELGWRLLNRRGFEAFLKGDMSPVEFGNTLAQEWASMPMLSGPHLGQSYYAGDGLNKSLVTPRDVMRRLAWVLNAAQNPSVHSASTVVKA